MGFLDEWRTENSMKYLGYLLYLASAVSLLWVITNITPELPRALVFALLGILSFSRLLFGQLDFGKKDDFIKALGIGAGGILVITQISPSFAIASPILAATLLTANQWLLYYIVGTAPLNEEKFFRGALFPTLSEHLKRTGLGFAAPYAAVILASVVFALFHYLAYGASFGAMQQAFIFSVIAIVGNSVTKSLGFGIGMHIANNWLAFQGMG